MTGTPTVIRETCFIETPMIVGAVCGASPVAISFPFLAPKVLLSPSLKVAVEAAHQVESACKRFKIAKERANYKGMCKVTPSRDPSARWRCGEGKIEENCLVLDHRRCHPCALINCRLRSPGFRH